MKIKLLVIALFNQCV